MKGFILSTSVVLFLPTALHAFLASTKSTATVNVQSRSRLWQNYYDQQGDGNQQQPYYDQQQPAYYDQGEGQPQQSYYDQDPQQPQYYDDPQQQPAQNAEEPSLLITDNIQQEMAAATSGVEVGGIDFLALARQRAAERRESNNSESTAEEWIELAEEVRREKMAERGGYISDDEDWEKSLDDEGGLSDSAALGMGVKLEEAEGGVMMTEGGLVVDGGEGGEDGPQLLL